MTSPLGSALAGVSYTHLGQVGQTMQLQGAQTWRTYTYDPGRLRLSEVLQQRNATSNAVVSDDHYTYDNAGDVTIDNNVTVTAGTDTQCYTYDYLQQLTAVRRLGVPSTLFVASLPMPVTIGVRVI